MGTTSALLKSGCSNACLPRFQLMKEVVDFAVTPLSADLVAKILTIPAGALVLKVGLRTLTVEAGKTISVGDSDSGTTFLTTQSIATLTDAADAMDNVDSVGKYYATASDVRITASAAVSVGKVEVWALVVLTA